MLNTENIVVYLIFTLVIVVALFNLIGALIMMILDKRKFKTLYNLGIEITDLRKIFLLQGTLLSVIGGVIGLVIGIVIVLLQQHFEFIMLTQLWLIPLYFL
jgi:lipoprotein-releasing system permease protein